MIQYFITKKAAGMTKPDETTLASLAVKSSIHPDQITSIRKSIDGKEIITQIYQEKDIKSTDIPILTDYFNLFKNAAECRQYIDDNTANWNEE